MVDRTKKRKKSVSPHSSRASAKRHQQSSAAIQGHAALANGSVSTSADYRFRLKVIASAKDVGDDVFEEAIRGLVQMCFPESILDEIGVDVIASHMEQDGAPPETINKMRSVFNTLMINRMGHMLARYTDTPEKLECAISTLSDASQSLHGLGHTAGTMDDSSAASPASSSSDSSDDEPASLGKANKKKQKGKMAKDCRGADKSQKTKQQSSTSTKRKANNGNTQVSAPHVSMSFSTDFANMSVEENKEVSEKWQWDVDPSKISREDAMKIFEKTSDLYAYHALPVMQQRLGRPTNARKKITRMIQTALDELTVSEYCQWTESLRKLRNGDMRMLERGLLGNSTAKAECTREVLASSSRNQQNGALEERSAGAGDDAGGSGADSIPVGGVSGPIVKTEPGADLSAASVVNTRAAQEEANVDVGNSVLKRPSTQGRLPLYDESTFAVTPIVNLLYGRMGIAYVTRNAAVQTIIHKLNNRISLDSIAINLLNGATRWCSRQKLFLSLKSMANHLQDHPSFPRTLRCDLESELRPWVMAQPTAFPELHGDPLFFVFLMPSYHPVFDLLYNSNTEVCSDNAEKATSKIISELRCRAYQGVGESLAIDKLSERIKLAFTEPHVKYGLQGRRGMVERILRYAAIAYKDKFPELKSSFVVEVWERTYGLEW